MFNVFRFSFSSEIEKLRMKTEFDFNFALENTSASPTVGNS